MATGHEWHKRLQKINIPPMVDFKRAGIRCSLWLPIGISFFTGWLAGVLGIGGGLIRMPALIYLLGVPTHVAVGTDLFEVAISGLYGAATYSYKGRVEIVAALIMLLGAAVGAQIGTVATKYVKGYGIRIFFGVAVIGCELSVIDEGPLGHVPLHQDHHRPDGERSHPRRGVGDFTLHPDRVPEGGPRRAGPTRREAGSRSCVTKEHAQ